MRTAEYAASLPSPEISPLALVAVEEFAGSAERLEAPGLHAITQTLLPEVAIFPAIDLRPTLINELNQLLDDYSLDQQFDRLIDDVATDGIFIWELEPNYGLGVHVKGLPGSKNHTEVMMAIFPESSGEEHFLRLESQILIEGKDSVYFTMSSQDEMQPPLPVLAAVDYMSLLLRHAKASKKTISTLDL